ncbi:MAG TPA: ABC transporter ATP-binding protein [Rhodanobacteraceae bacterium]|nr:ABC transporter ATP-binding protein [Rhodanobacteraceae bacterium]
MTEESTQETDRHDAEQAMPRWLHELKEAAAAVQQLAQAQWQLLGAEWRLARSAATTALLALLVGGLFAAALGLTLLALGCLLLAYALGSWIWALLVMGGILALCLLVSILLLRRCLHWMSLPETRAQWGALAHGLALTKKRSPHVSGETKDHETASSID